MTKQQELKLKRIKETVILEWVKDQDSEIKQFKVEETPHFVSLVIEVGLKGDEGTLAAVFGRYRAHLFIGRKGGLTYVDKKGKIRKLKYINLWEVHIAQNN